MPESAKEGDSVLPEGSDIGLGCRGWVFKSPHSDQNPSEINDFRGVFLMPLGVEINPRFYRGKKNSFSMRLSEGKQILESNHLDEKEMLKE